MKRHATTPLILWICAAICVHFVFGGGASEVATVLRRPRLPAPHGHRRAAHRVRRAGAGLRRIALRYDEEGRRSPPEPPPLPAPKPKPPEPKKEPAAPKLAKTEKKQPDPKKEEKKTIIVAKDEKAKPPLPPAAASDHRLSGEAERSTEPGRTIRTRTFIGDQANHVEQETAATKLTSHDRDDPNPTPGGKPRAGPQGETGDSDRTKIADSEQHAGDKTRAPGERGHELEEQKDPMPQTPPAAVAVQGQKTQAVPRRAVTGGWLPRSPHRRQRSFQGRRGKRRRR